MQDSGINVLWEGRNALRILEGLAVTLGVSAVSVALSLVLGVGVGLAMRSRLAPLRWLVRAGLVLVRCLRVLGRVVLAGFGGRSSPSPVTSTSPPRRWAWTPGRPCAS